MNLAHSIVILKQVEFKYKEAVGALEAKNTELMDEKLSELRDLLDDIYDRTVGENFNYWELLEGPRSMKSEDVEGLVAMVEAQIKEARLAIDWGNTISAETNIMIICAKIAKAHGGTAPFFAGPLAEINQGLTDEKKAAVEKAAEKQANEEAPENVDDNISENIEPSGRHCVASG